MQVELEVEMIGLFGISLQMEIFLLILLIYLFFLIWKIHFGLGNLYGNFKSLQK